MHTNISNGKKEKIFFKKKPLNVQRKDAMAANAQLLEWQGRERERERINHKSRATDSQRISKK